MTNTNKTSNGKTKTLMTATAIALVAAIGLSAGAQAFGGKERGHGGMRGSMGGPGSIFMQGIDENGDGTVTEAEVQEKLSSLFAMADGDSDGAVTMEELTAARDAMHESRGEGRGEGRGGKRWHRGGDDDGKGYGRRGGRQHGKRGGGMQKMFERADANSDGKVSEVEFADATSVFVDNIAYRANKSLERKTERFNELDTDGNGQISKEEYEAGAPGRNRN